MLRLLLPLFFSLFFWQPIYADIKFLTISDIHYGENNTGEIRHDPGPMLLQLTMKKYKELAQQVDFIIELGDIPTHSLSYDPSKGKYLATVFDELRKGDSKKVPLFYIPGNNDSLRGNYQAFLWHHKSPTTFAKDWQGSCVFCEGLMIDSTHLKQQGYYSSYVIAGNKDVVLIALNTVLFAKVPLVVLPYPNRDEAAKTQLAWLQQQLEKLHAKQLIIAMHIPPGLNYIDEPMWKEKDLQEFIALLKKAYPRFEQITLLTSHDHRDEIRRITIDKGNAIYAFSTPSISRIYRNNPGMKIYNLNQQNKLNNFTTYYTSNNKTWENEQYSAIASDGIFPNCINKNLMECLNSLDTEQICNFIEGGLYYGVKSKLVKETPCKTNLPVN